MTKVEEKICKWESVSLAYQTWLNTLAPKHKIGKTIYTQLAETFEAIVNDLKELNDTNRNQKFRECGIGLNKKKLELQKFIDELEVEKQKADKTANFWEGHDKGRQEYYIGVSDSLLLAIDKARCVTVS